MDIFVSSDQIKDSKLSEKTRKRYNRIASVYDQMEWFVEKKFFSEWRKLLWAQIKAENVLEIGVGTGKNIPYYPAHTELTAVDLSEGMMAKAESRAEQLNRVVDFQLMDVESLKFPDDTFDAAIATFVFCSVPDPIRGLKELSRVVKPGGDIWLLDNVRINKPVIGTLMDLINPLVVRMMGANINRRTLQNVHQSGLKIHNVKNLKSELVQLIQAGPDQNQSSSSMS